MESLYSDRGVKSESRFPGYLNLGPTNMPFLEQKLPVQIAHINSIQINLNTTAEGTSTLKVELIYQVETYSYYIFKPRQN